MTFEPLLTLDQALAALECSEDELDALIRDGEVAAYRIADGRYGLNPPPGPWEPAPPPPPSISPTVSRRRGRPLQPIEDRFWAKVDRQGPIPEHRPELGECWVWTASTNGTGYGVLRLSHPRRHAFAHRVAYELLVGPIPDGLQIDHLCRNRGCVNPDHLEPVTGRENVLRGIGFAAIQAKQTHCKNGHPLFGANLYMAPGSTKRVCRTCKREDNRRRANPNRSGEDA